MKSLQNVTDLVQLTTEQNVQDYLNEHPDKIDEVIKSLKKRINESYNKKLGREEELTAMLFYCLDLKGEQDEKRVIGNMAYEQNRLRIAAYLHNAIVENRCFPTVATIAVETGLSRTTVYRHLNNGLNDEYNSLVKGKYQYMANSALEQLYLIGISEKNATALKAFIQFTINNTQHQSIHNYIQVNSLTLSQSDIAKLPSEVLDQIVQLIEASNSA